jgi:hypothetical protein
MYGTNFQREQINSDPPFWDLDEGLATHHHKKQLYTGYYTRPRTSADSLERPKQWEVVMKHYWSD